MNSRKKAAAYSVFVGFGLTFRAESPSEYTRLPPRTFRSYAAMRLFFPLGNPRARTQALRHTCFGQDEAEGLDRAYAEWWDRFGKGWTGLDRVGKG